MTNKGELYKRGKKHAVGEFLNSVAGFATGAAMFAVIGYVVYCFACLPWGHDAHWLWICPVMLWVAPYCLMYALEAILKLVFRSTGYDPH